MFFHTLARAPAASPATVANWYDVKGRATIYTLPDPVLSISFLRGSNCKCRGVANALHLQLVCSNETPVREALDVWPPLPIVVGYHHPPTSDVNNALADLEHDRLCQVTLWGVPSPQLERFSAVMKEPFPARTYLWLKPNDDQAAPVHVILDSFLEDLHHAYDCSS